MIERLESSNSSNMFKFQMWGHAYRQTKRSQMILGNKLLTFINLHLHLILSLTAQRGDYNILEMTC